jgi:hypothetical protein
MCRLSDPECLSNPIQFIQSRGQVLRGFPILVHAEPPFRLPRSLTTQIERGRDRTPAGFTRIDNIRRHREWMDVRHPTRNDDPKPELAMEKVGHLECVGRTHGVHDAHILDGCSSRAEPVSVDDASQLMSRIGADLVKRKRTVRARNNVRLAAIPHKHAPIFPMQRVPAVRHPYGIHIEISLPASVGPDTTGPRGILDTVLRLHGAQRSGQDDRGDKGRP